MSHSARRISLVPRPHGCLSLSSEYEANTGYNREGLENSQPIGSVGGTVTTAMLAVGGEDSSSIGGAGGMLEGQVSTRGHQIPVVCNSRLYC